LHEVDPDAADFREASTPTRGSRERESWMIVDPPLTVDGPRGATEWAFVDGAHL
jgi:hypothetical protein